MHDQNNQKQENVVDIKRSTLVFYFFCQNNEFPLQTQISDKKYNSKIPENVENLRG